MNVQFFHHLAPKNVKFHPRTSVPPVQVYSQGIRAAVCDTTCSETAVYASPIIFRRSHIFDVPEHADGNISLWFLLHRVFPWMVRVSHLST